MRKYILLIVLLLYGSVITNASILTKNEVELAVGSNPVSILEDPSDGMIHIFCAGIDANDNNAFDEGEDEKPSWWTYNPAGNSVKPTMVKEFDNYFVSPFKPTVDTTDGTKIGIYFKSNVDDDNVNNNKFFGFSKYIIYQTSTFNILFEDKIFQGELIDYRKVNGQLVRIIRKNGYALLSSTNIATNEETKIEIIGDVIDFVSFSDEEENRYLVPVVFDGNRSTLVVFKIDSSVGAKKLFESGIGTYGIIKDNLKSITTDGHNLFLLNSKKTYSTPILFLNETKDKFSYYYKPVYDFIFANLYITSIIDSLYIVSKESKDLVILDLNNTINTEMHHTQFVVEYIYSTGSQVYCASKSSKEKRVGRISIYDFTNEPNIDVSKNDMGYTGYQPLDIFPFVKKLKLEYYTVCMGIDNNFDGIINEEEGDLTSSIWSSNLILSDSNYGRVYLEKELNFPINFPLRTNVSPLGTIAIPSGNKVYYYKIEDNEVYGSFDAGMYVASAFRVMNYFVLGLRDYTNNKSYVRITRTMLIDDTTEVGTNVIDALVYNNVAGSGILSLSEGNFGQADSKINIIKLEDNKISENTELEVGIGGNSIVMDSAQTKVAIVMNGSHEIHILNLLTSEIDTTFSTATTGYGGPRNAKFVGELLYVTTYSDRILVFNHRTGKKVSSIIIDGNAEGLAVSENKLFATNIQYSNYQPNNRIFAYDLDKITSVEEAVPTQQTIRVYPNPVANDFHLVSDDLAGTNDIAIINSQGKIVATHSGTSNGAIALNADALGLIAGNYTAIINGTRAVRFVVIK